MFIAFGCIWQRRAVTVEKDGKREALEFVMFPAC